MVIVPRVGYGSYEDIMSGKIVIPVATNETVIEKPSSPKPVIHHHHNEDHNHDFDYRKSLDTCFGKESDEAYGFTNSTAFFDDLSTTCVKK